MIPEVRAGWYTFLAGLFSLSLGFSVHANIYPTNIKINGSFTNLVVSTGAGVKISYILNEPASAGVTIRVSSGTNVVRTISLAAGTPGTLRGTNQVVWDGNGSNSIPVTQGIYSFAITAASHGYPGWTQITDDTADGNNVWIGRGIGVDRNTNSPYYGRIFVANAEANDPGANNWLGYQVGILKCNADASYADEGGLSTGGYPWAGDTYSPWHLEVSSDDFAYVNDLTTNGQVIRWDARISTNSETFVLRPDNWANLNVGLSGPALHGNGTNKSLWMADATYTSGTQIGRGILRYNLLPNGTCATGDKGITAVAVGGSLTGNPVDVALDAAGNIYTIQNNSDPGDPSNRVFRFPAFTGPTNSAPITNADWAIGAGDDTMAGANGIALDPTGTYVAVAFTGLSTGTNGCTQIFSATNGTLVTNIDLGVSISDTPTHQDEDCGWDAVGNLYYIDNYYGAWRAVSPPGTNQSTTIALASIDVVAPPPSVPAQITGISVAAGLVTIDFSAGTNDTAASFSVLGATNILGPYQTISGATITALGSGKFKATFPTGGKDQYYRISRLGTAPPPSGLAFTKISHSGNNVVLLFNGDITDTPSSFAVLGAASVSGSYSTATNAIITQLSPGSFEASLPATGPAQFYRIKK
jgi:hypothetical protein